MDLRTLTTAERRAAVRHLKDENRRHGDRLERVPVGLWWHDAPAGMFDAWRSSRFLVACHHAPGGVVRLTVNRTAIDASGAWLGGITWDELQAIKAQCGYGDFEAVEVYPPESSVVNVATMRHLWVLPLSQRMPFSW